MQYSYRLNHILFVSFLCLLFYSCKKLIKIDPPVDSIETSQIFSTNAQAEWALSGVYSRMINGSGFGIDPEREYFSAGLANLAGCLSSDELFGVLFNGNPAEYALTTNTLDLANSTYPVSIWNSAYKTVYDANAVLEGIASSTSSGLTDSARKQISAEAKAIRAFSYFYLVNFFGDVPLVLTIDFSKTKNLPRAPQLQVYEQIIKDLTEARADLPADYHISNNERIRINKWCAEGLLARIYLFAGQYQNAINSATAVISQSELFQLETDMERVFLKGTPEAVWQLQQNDPDMDIAVPEARNFRPGIIGDPPLFEITNQLMSVFEPQDKRLISWTGNSVDINGGAHPYVYKYKKAFEYGEVEEYNIVMRLPELYLIRAEANLLLSSGNTGAAVNDLNILRQRAGIDDISSTLTAQQVTDSIATERQRELFAEWAHRWFDLKRTGKASTVLSNIGYKQPWRGDYQLLYPIPASEIQKNLALTQNPEYNNN